MMMSSGKSSRRVAALFDMDGLLLNSESIYTMVTNRILADYGKVFPMSVKLKMMGRPARDAARIFINEMELEGQLSAEDYLARRDALQDAAWSETQLKPGVERLLTHLFDHPEVEVALATSSYSQATQLKTAHHALFDRFSIKVMGDDAELKRGKPAPDIFLLAAQRLGVDPADCVVFEDSPLGVEAATAAGMASVFVPHQFSLKVDPDHDPDVAQSAIDAHPLIQQVGATKTVVSLALLDDDIMKGVRLPGFQK